MLSGSGSREESSGGFVFDEENVGGFGSDEETFGGVGTDGFCALATRAELSTACVL